MRYGNLKVAKFYSEGKYKWAVYGRERKLFGRWIVCFDEKRKSKELIFDLEYDACGYLQGFIEWQIENRLGSKPVPYKDKPIAIQINGKTCKTNKRRAKAKMAKASRRRNR